MKKEWINRYFRRLGFEIHGNGYLQSLHKNVSKEDAFETQMKIFKGKVNVILDVGANRGNTALKYASLFKRATIYAFEPFPETLNKLYDNVKGYDNIIPTPFAISDSNGKSIFYSNANEDTNSLLPSDVIGANSDRQVKNISSLYVDTVTLDAFCQNHHVSQIDILKMDIQGSELSALKGAQSLLINKKIKLIYTEAYFRKQYVGQPLFHDISTFLEPYGYYIQDIYNPIYGKGNLLWCDAIFVSG